MKIINNKHIDYSSQVQLGDLIICENGKHYIFIADPDETLPYLQIDLDTYEIVDRYPDDAFFRLKLGSDICIGDRIVEIVKNKNLTLSYTS